MITKSYRDKFTSDGVTSNYVTTQTFLSYSTLVFINGILAQKGVDYNEGADLKSINFINIPEDTWLIEIYYLYQDASEVTEESPVVDELLDVLNGILDIKRETPLLLDKTLISASMSVDRQPLKSCRLGITVSGATITAGTISIAGTTDETFSFTANDIKIGEKDYENISGIAVDGISDGTVEIKAVTKTGQPINQEKIIHSNLPVYFYAINGKIKMMPAGKEKDVKYRFLTLPTKPIKENDIFYSVAGIQAMTCGRVDFVSEIIDLAGVTHHVECDCLPI